MAEDKSFLVVVNDIIDNILDDVFDAFPHHGDTRADAYVEIAEFLLDTAEMMRKDVNV